MDRDHSVDRGQLMDTGGMKGRAIEPIGATFTLRSMSCLRLGCPLNMA